VLVVEGCGWDEVNEASNEKEIRQTLPSTLTLNPYPQPLPTTLVIPLTSLLLLTSRRRPLHSLSLCVVASVDWSWVDLILKYTVVDVVSLVGCGVGLWRCQCL
jgi:hypothetical protein